MMWHAFVDMYCVMLYIKLLLNIFIIVCKMSTWCMKLGPTWRPTSITTRSYGYVPQAVPKFPITSPITFPCRGRTFPNDVHEHGPCSNSIHDPCWIHDPIPSWPKYFFCNFGTPRIPKKFNWVSNVIHTADVPLVA